MSYEFNELKKYLEENIETFCSTTSFVGTSQLNVPYIILLTEFGSYLKIEYSETKHIVNVFISDNRIQLIDEKLKELAEFLMKINVKNTVGHWVVFPQLKRIAYKTTTKFPSNEMNVEIVKELILSSISSFQRDVERFSNYYQIVQPQEPTSVDFN